MTMTTVRSGRLIVAGGVLTLVVACPKAPQVESAQCWCGERWQVQISGAYAYTDIMTKSSIAASSTTHTRCVSMLEHIALDKADPDDPVYVALHDAFESEAIANCELAGFLHWPEHFDYTNCATTGSGDVSTNLSWTGPCWVSESPETDPPKLCPLEAECGRFYDCSDDPIILEAGETGGAEDELLWNCGPGVAAAADRVY